ncbi:MAG: MBL fold metallo-hydrolase [Defluviitaleaceae bacterium]|nr:MBL fold metallo-hydrolase [Defluviitaleaceae bacterium]
MTKNKLDENIFQYCFKPDREGKLMGDTIVALTHGDRALLIDVGYSNEAKQVADEFKAEGITVEKVVISHFHSDHYYGLDMFPNATIYGSANFKETFISEGHGQEHIDNLPEFTKISEPTTLTFGKHKLELIPFSGHSVCTLLVKINDKFLFTADDLIFTIDGRLMLPWLCGMGSRDELIDRQLKGWDKLRGYEGFTIIPAHGLAFEGSKLAGYLDSLTAYLTAIKNANGEITYDEAVKNCATPPLNQSFGESSWHDHNKSERN